MSIYGEYNSKDHDKSYCKIRLEFKSYVSKNRLRNHEKSHLIDRDDISGKFNSPTQYYDIKIIGKFVKNMIVMFNHHCCHAMKPYLVWACFSCQTAYK